MYLYINGLKETEDFFIPCAILVLLGSWWARDGLLPVGGQSCWAADPAVRWPGSVEAGGGRATTVLQCTTYGRQCPLVYREVLLCKAAPTGQILLLVGGRIWAAPRCCHAQQPGTLTQQGPRASGWLGRVERKKPLCAVAISS
jgi:hypothetical protein